METAIGSRAELGPSKEGSLDIEPMPTCLGLLGKAFHRMMTVSAKISLNPKIFLKVSSHVRSLKS